MIIFPCPTLIKRAVWRSNGIAETSWERLNASYTMVLAKPLQSGKFYEIRVSHPDFPTISAQQKMPSLVPLDSVIYEKDGALSQEGNRLNQVRFYFKDPPGEENYYEVLLVANSTCLKYLRRDPQTNKFVYDTLDCEISLFLDGATHPSAHPGDYSMLITDKTFNGSNFTFGVNFGNWFTIKSIIPHGVRFCAND
jgi:hypothetical protein